MHTKETVTKIAMIGTHFFKTFILNITLGATDTFI